MKTDLKWNLLMKKNLILINSKKLIFKGKYLLNFVRWLKFNAINVYYGLRINSKKSYYYNKRDVYLVKSKVLFILISEQLYQHCDDR